MNVLLSCLCNREFDYSPPQVAEEILCLTHGAVWVISAADVSILECLDCGFRREFSPLVKLTPCHQAINHMLKTRHRTRHFKPIDMRGTMCLHNPIKAPVITRGQPPF